jgi:hypothetical protein
VNSPAPATLRAHLMRSVLRGEQQEARARAQPNPAPRKPRC